MEVEELSPLAQRFPLTPTKGVPDEDDGFVDILENDLEVRSLTPSGPLHLPPWDVPEESSELLQQDYDCIPMSEESEVTESQPDLWPIREEQVAAAAVRKGWEGGGNALLHSFSWFCASPSSEGSLPSPGSEGLPCVEMLARPQRAALED